MNLDCKNVYECTFISDKGRKVHFVAASTFGRAAFMANASISSWEDKEAYELVNIRLSNSIFVE